MTNCFKLKSAALFFLALFLFPVFSTFPRSKSSVIPQNLRYEYLLNPTGLDEVHPRFSWTLEARDDNAFGQRQTAYRIVVASSEKGLKKDKGDVWDSGWVSSDKMQHITYAGPALQSDRSYYWKVAVKDEEGRVSRWSKTAHWTTGLFKQSEWSAKWIGTDEIFDPSLADCNINDPWLRKTFELDSRPEKATLFVASVGFHEVYVNGKRIGDDVMAPAVSDHTKRARYVAYEMAPALRKGKNVVSIWLGTSWSIHGPYVSDHRPNTPIVIAQAAIYKEKEADQRPVMIIKTDESWKTHPSPNKLLGTWNSNRMGGELYDANKEIEDWNRVSCDESSWKSATVYQPKLTLSAQQVEANRLFDEIKPVASRR